MDRRRETKRLALLLCAALLFMQLNTTAYAVGGKGSTGGLCVHHPEHTLECGYEEGTPETPCSHKHSDDCYRLEKKCIHKHTAECYADEDLLDGAATPTNADAADLTGCEHICGEDTGCIKKVLDCPHVHDDQCGYVKAVPGSSCTNHCELCAPKKDSGTQPATFGQNIQKPECDCTEACTADSINPNCPVCGADGVDLHDCEGADEATYSNAKKLQTIIGWEWSNPDAGLVNGRFSIPDINPDKQLSFDALTEKLPKSITVTVEGEADTQKVALVWTCDTYTQKADGNWPVQGEYLFTANPLNGYALADDAEPLEIKVTLGVANGLADYNGLTITGGAVTQEADGQIKLTESNADYVISGTWNGDITGLSEENRKAVITVSDGVTANVKLNGVTIDVGTPYDYKKPFGLGAFALDGTAEAHVRLSGANTLKSSYPRAGLEVPENATLTITGAADDKLIANSAFCGAGIGGGDGESSGTITISGGNVEAYSYSRGAGIGGGSSGNGGTITISGGKVEASSGYGGAGIGGGSSGNGGTITISGGDVEAHGGLHGAGIGGGYAENGGGNSGTITISGGKVMAESNSQNGGTGIGSGGFGGSGETILISGGSVEASGYTDIGGGQSSGGHGTIHISGGIVKADNVGGQPTNSEGARVYKGELTGQSGVTGVSVDGAPCYVDTNLSSDDSTLYLYMTGKDHAVNVRRSGSVTAYTAAWQEATETFSFTSGDTITPTQPMDIAFDREIFQAVHGQEEPFPITGTLTIPTNALSRSRTTAMDSLQLTVSQDDNTLFTQRMGRNELTLSGSSYLFSFAVDVSDFAPGSYSVKAEYGGDGKSLASSKTTTLNITAPLAEPQNPTWDSVGTGRVTWNAVEHATGYSVQLYKNGSAVGNANTTTGTEYTFPITEAGSYTFKVKATGDNIDYFESSEVTSGSLQFFAVSFDTKGVGTVDQQIIAKGAKVAEPGDLTKTDYTLDGWYGDNSFSDSSKWDFDNSTVFQTTILYAKWLSTDVSVTAVSVSGVTGTLDDTTITAVLPYGSAQPTDAGEVSVTAAAGATIAAPVTSDNGQTWTFTVTAENGMVTKNYTIKVFIAANPAAVIITADLPGGTVGTAYSATLTATGDTPISWSVVSGNLPRGLTLNNAAISGTPTAAGKFTFTVKATNENSPGSQKTFTITIASKNSDSDSSTNSDGIIITVIPAKPDSPTTGEVTIQKPGTGGAVTVTDSQVKSAIDKATYAAERSGRKSNGVAVSVKLPVDTVRAVLGRAALDRLISSSVKSFKTDFGGVSMTFDLAALKEIQRQSTGDITFSAEKAVLAGDALAVVGNRPSYDLKLSYQKNGQTFNLSKVGSVAVAIGYTLAENEKDGTLYGICADGQMVVWLDKSSYNKDSKAVLFSAEHLGIYAVGCREPV